MSNQAMRPAFVAKLLARPTPPLQPRSTISLESRLYAQELREEIAKQSCHPLIVSCLHLLNDDLESGNSQLAKLQSNSSVVWTRPGVVLTCDIDSDVGGFTSWMRGILAASSGDFGVAKMHYKETREEVLRTYHNISPSISPALQGSHLLDHFALLFSRSPEQIYRETVASDFVVSEAWNSDELQGRARVRGIGGETIEQRVLRMRWEELRSVFESAEKKYGWGTAQL